MFRLIPILSAEQISELRSIAASAQFVDGRISNPHSTVKNNLQLHDPAPHERSAVILRSALLASEEFRNVTFASALAPPMLTRYLPGMAYGLHSDTALMYLPHGVIRADISCTIFLSHPTDYEGGSLRISFGSEHIAFKGAAGTAICYPSTTLHEVEPVLSGERLVGLTFIQSRIGDAAKRDLLYELNEVAALEGHVMQSDNYTRLQAVQSNLLRRWSDPG